MAFLYVPKMTENVLMKIIDNVGQSDKLLWLSEIIRFDSASPIIISMFPDEVSEY